MFLLFYNLYFFFKTQVIAVENMQMSEAKRNIVKIKQNQTQKNKINSNYHHFLQAIN
jgi:hypothetical protein